MIKSIFLLFLIISFAPTSSFGGGCSEEKNPYECYKTRPAPDHVGRYGFIEIANLHPTQFFYGQEEVDSKLEKLRDMKSEKRHQYILDRPVILVIGPDGEYYVVDHHHLVLAVKEFGKNKVFAKVIARFSGITMNQFWHIMIQKHWASPFGKDHKELSPTEFADKVPANFSEMIGDPYRSLAAELRDAGYFIKGESDYQIEHEWANFLRERIVVGPGKNGYKKAKTEAFRLAASSESLGLRGRANFSSCESLFRLTYY